MTRLWALTALIAIAADAKPAPARASDAYFDQFLYEEIQVDDGDGASHTETRFLTTMKSDMDQIDLSQVIREPGRAEFIPVISLALGANGTYRLYYNEIEYWVPLTGGNWFYSSTCPIRFEGRWDVVNQNLRLGDLGEGSRALYDFRNGVELRLDASRLNPLLTDRALKLHPIHFRYGDWNLAPNPPCNETRR